MKAVLFDIDGTILDTFDFVYLAVQYTLNKHNLVQRNCYKKQQEGLFWNTTGLFYQVGIMKN